MPNIQFRISVIVLLVFLIPVTGYCINGQFVSKVSTGIESTDNLNLSETKEESDTITKIAPVFLINLISSENSAFFSYTGAYNYYTEHDENDTLGHKWVFNYKNQLTKFSTLTINDFYTETEDPKLDEVNDVRSSRQKYRTNTAGVDYLFRFGENDDVGTNFQYALLENDDELLNDNESYSGGILVNYEIMPHLRSLWKVDMTHASFDVNPPVKKNEDYNSTEFNFKLEKDFTRNTSGFINYDHINMHYLDGDAEDYIVFDPSIGLKWHWDKNSFLSLGLGYIYEKTDNEPDDSKFSAEVDLKKLWAFRRGEYSISAANGYEQSYLDSSNDGLDFYYDANSNLKYQLTKKLGWFFNLECRYDMFENPGVSSNDRKDITYNASSGFDWIINEIFASSLKYEFNNRESDNNAYDYKENKVEFTINLTYWNKRF